MGGGMLGAVSNTEGVRDSAETEEAVGWYDRDTGDSGLRGWYMGKPSSRSTLDGDVVGDMRSTNRVFLTAFLAGICIEGAPAFELESSALPASRRKSTMSASALFCLPTSDADMHSPSAAVVLFAPDMRESDSSQDGLLQEEDMSMESGMRRGTEHQESRMNKRNKRDTGRVARGTHGM
jgi:hypothetical protein